MRYQFRAIAPNEDLVLNHSGMGYCADDPAGAWSQLAALLSSGVDVLQRRYTIEEMR